MAAGAGQILVDASRPRGVHLQSRLCGGGWPTTPQSTGWGCTSTSPRPSRSTRTCLERWGKTPIQALDEYGVWDCGRALAAHCVYTTEEDWASWRRRGSPASTTPVSNLKLGSGVAPVPAMLQAGVNVALGTDGMSSHNSADLFSDIKLAAVLHNGVERDPMAVTAWARPWRWPPSTAPGPWAGIPGSSPRERRRT